MDAPYRDDREAALAAAEALRRENEELRSENEYLRGVLDPGRGALGRTAAQLQGALAVVSLLVGAMTGVAVLARDLPPPSPCGIARGSAAPGVPSEPIAVEVLPAANSAEHPDARRRWRNPAPAPVAAAPAPEMVTTARLARSFTPALGPIGRCARGAVGLYVDVTFNAGGEAVIARAVARHRSRDLIDAEAIRCVERAANAHVDPLPHHAPYVTARFTVMVSDGRARLRRVRW